MKVVSTVINIHLRPNLESLLSHEITKEIFIKYCKDNFVGESVACYLLIQEFKHLIFINNNNSNNSTNNSANDDNANNSTNNQSTSNNNSNNNKQQQQLQYGDDKKINELVHKIMKEYIREGSEHEINIDSQTRSSIINRMTQFTTLSTEEKAEFFGDVEFQILLMLASDVLPRFVRSKTWHQFVIENSEIATKCCSLEDLNLMKSLKYTKEDLKRKYLLMKDIQFADMVCLDYSCYEYLVGSKDINVYFCTGDTFFEDFGVGKSNVAKAIGYLPFCAEVVISCLRDPYGTRRIYPTTVFDTNEKNEEIIYLNKEFQTVNLEENHLTNNNDNSDNNSTNSTNKKDKSLPTELVKYHVQVSSLFDLRTNHVGATVIYYNSKYYYIAKCINNPEEFPSEYIYYKNGKKYTRQTVPMISISMHVITPISKDKCHYVHFASGNLGGIFTKISTLSVFKKMLGKVSVKSRETLISVLNEFKQERYVCVKDGYERVRKSIELFNEAYGITKECPFPKTFEELQEL
ncbi:hypothetical protein ABK040_007349 [Willaertia magna]